MFLASGGRLFQTRAAERDTGWVLAGSCSRCCWEPRAWPALVFIFIFYLMHQREAKKKITENNDRDNKGERQTMY